MLFNYKCAVESKNPRPLVLPQILCPGRHASLPDGWSTDA